MSQSLSLVIVHLIFSTKEREPFLREFLRTDMHGYLATIARDTGCQCYRGGGVADHVHLAIRLTRTISIADLVEHIKIPSSKWAKRQAKELSKFSWQHGYGCFSISPKNLDALVKYIDHQEQQHQRRTFQDEFRAFLEKYGVEYDEAFVWD